MCLISPLWNFSDWEWKKGKCRMREKGNDFYQKLPVMCSCVVVGSIIETLFVGRHPDCEKPTALSHRQTDQCCHRSPLPDIPHWRRQGRGCCAVLCFNHVGHLYDQKSDCDVWPSSFQHQHKLSPANNTIIAVWHNYSACVMLPHRDVSSPS